MIDIDNMSILIVDDMKTTRAIIQKTLKRLDLGQTIHFAANGREGLDCLANHKVDIAIIDWNMPVMTGAQMLDAIRSDIKLRDLPVLMVTAESEKDIVMEVAEIEVDAYMLKPLTPALLDEKIRSVVEKANHPDECSLQILKARECEESGNISAAIRYMQIAVRLKPQASRVRRNLGILYGKAGNPAKMEDCFLKAAALNPQDAVTRHLISKLYWEKGDREKAVEYEIEVLSLTNRFDSYALDIAKSLLGMNENAMATGLLDGLVFKTEKNLPLKEEILDLCMEYRVGDLAMRLVKKLIREFPSHHDLFYKAGLLHYAFGNPDKALEYFFHADRHSVRPVETKLKIARIFCEKEKIIQADEYLTQVLGLDPDNAEAHSLKASI